MATTTYEQNTEASRDTTFIESLSSAMAETAKNIQSESTAGLSLPSGYNKGSTDTIKKQNLHEERVALAYEVLGNPEGYAVKYAISAAEQMDVYLDSGTVKMANDDAVPSNSDYSNACTALWNAWSVEENTLSTS